MGGIVIRDDWRLHICSVFVFATKSNLLWLRGFSFIVRINSFRSFALWIMMTFSLQGNQLFFLFVSLMSKFFCSLDSVIQTDDSIVHTMPERPYFYSSSVEKLIMMGVVKTLPILAVVATAEAFHEKFHFPL